MISKIKNFIKNDWQYLTFGIILLIITLLIATINYNSEETPYVVNTPFSSVYGLVSWSLVLILGISGIFLFKNASKDGIRLEKKYLLIAIPIGIIMVFVTPLGRIPDEVAHARKAAAISQGNIFSVADEEGVAKDMLNSKINELVSISTTTYEEYIERLNLAETEEKVEMSYNTMALYAPICHLPQALGMLITRLLGFGISVQCFAARFANLAVAIFLIYNAIKFIPYKKSLVLFLGLLPLTFNISSTISSDSLTFALSLFYIAYILYLKYSFKGDTYTKKELAIIYTSTIILSLCKIVYLPLCFLLIVLPKEKFGSMKKKIISLSIVISISIILNLMWLIYCTRFLIEFNPGVNSKDQLIYILTNPFEYLLIMFRTINFHFNIYIAHTCGDGLGLYCVKAPEMFIYACTALITLFFFKKDEQNDLKIDLFTKIIFFLVFACIVVLIYTSLYIQWNPVKYPMITGVQARYFLPILFLVAVFLDNDKLILKENINRYLLCFLLFFNLALINATMYTYYFGVLVDGYIK